MDRRKGGSGGHKLFIRDRKKKKELIQRSAIEKNHAKNVVHQSGNLSLNGNLNPREAPSDRGRGKKESPSMGTTTQFTQNPPQGSEKGALSSQLTGPGIKRRVDVIESIVKFVKKRPCTRGA